jgi:hypothetical protein
MSDADLKRSALAEALKQSEGFLRRSQHIEALSPVFKALEQVRVEASRD